MITKSRSIATMAALLATTLGGTVAFAQGAQTQTSPPPATQRAPKTGMGMMGQGGTPGQAGSMGQMDMAQMNKMMEGCNKMMERAMQNPPAGSAAPDSKG